MKKPKVFDIGKFLNIFSKKNKPIETKDISQWLNINVRNIQIFASKFNIPYNRIHGRKYYIWNETTLFFFKVYYERYNDKQPKKYYIPKPKKVKVKPESDKITFTTIKDIVNEHCVFPSKNGDINLFTKLKHKTHNPKML
jgi:hypothetical protein